MPRIKLSEKMNDASKLASVDTSGYKEMYLDAGSIIPAEENFYPLDEIEELADDLLDRGQLQPLLIARVDGKYKLAVGHRRREAIIFNNKRGHVHKAWCFAKEMDYTEFMLTLISANAYTRKMDDATLLKQAEKLNYWTQAALREGKLTINGPTRNYVAGKLKISPTKMAQVNQVNAHLSDEGKQALKNGKMNFTKAYETSKLPPDKQSAVIQDENLLSADVKNMVRKEKDVEIKLSGISAEEPSADVDFPQQEVTVNMSLSPKETSDFFIFFNEKVQSYPMHLEIYYSKTMDWCITIYKKGCGEDGKDLSICREQDCDMELCFAKAYASLKEWFSERRY